MQKIKLISETYTFVVILAVKLLYMCYEAV